MICFDKNCSGRRVGCYLCSKNHKNHFGKTIDINTILKSIKIKSEEQTELL